MSIINNISDKEYEALKGINSSSVKKFLVSPKHYQDWLMNKDEDADNSAFKVGSAVHMACLQPKRFVLNYVCAPEVDRRTTVGKQMWNEFVEASSGMTVLTVKEWEEVIRIQKAVLANEYFKKQMTGEVYTECGISCDYNGSTIKGRLDLYNETNNIILDIKTISEVPTKIAAVNAIRNYEYTVQDYIYKQLVHSLKFHNELPKFVFMFVEKKQPNSTALFEIGDEWCNNVKTRVDDALCRMENCLVTNIWTGLHNENEPIIL